MKRSLKETLIRIVILFIGLSIAHLGVTLFLLADLGADPFNVLVQGIFRTLSSFMSFPLLTHGNTHVVICFLIILALLVIDRSYIKIGTILCMIFGGPIIDFFTAILSAPFANMDSLILKIIVNGLGCIILAFGMTIVIKSDAGTGPNDLVSIAISDKLKKNFGVIRIIVDVSFVVIGFILGGSFGIGTLICAFLVGPVANIFLPFNGNLVDMKSSKWWERTFSLEIPQHYIRTSPTTLQLSHSSKYIEI